MEAFFLVLSCFVSELMDISVVHSQNLWCSEAESRFSYLLAWDLEDLWLGNALQIYVAVISFRADLVDWKLIW